MRKHLFKIFCGLFLVLFVASCDKDNEGEIYNLATDEPVGLSLIWSEGTMIYTPSDTSANIPVVRINTGGELVVPVKVVYDEAVFSIPASVTFADGESQALLSFSLNKAVYSKSYSINVELDVDSAKLVKYGTYVSNNVKKIADYGVKKAEIKVMKDYSWKSIGEGTLNSTWLVEDGIAVQVQKADGYDVYRVVNPYSDDYNLVIAVDGAEATVENQQIDLYDGSPIYVVGKGTYDQGIITLTLDFTMYDSSLSNIEYQEKGDVETIILP